MAALQAQSTDLFALHHAIGTSGEERRSVHGLHLVPRSRIVVADFVNNAFATDPASVTRSQPPDGWTPMHVAGISHNPEAIRALLALPATSGVQATVTARVSARGLTPLDLVEEKMEIDKEFNRETAMLGFNVFEGHTPGAARCVYLLKRATGAELWTETERNNPSLNLDAMSESEKEDRFVEWRRYECTCSYCIGCFSPRVLVRLAGVAQKLYTKVLPPSGEPLEFSPALGKEFYGTGPLDYIPVAARHNVTSAWFKGYHALFALIRAMLESLQDPAAPHTMPTPAALLEFARTVPVPADVHGAAPGDADIRKLLDRDYLAHGGRVEYALDAVVAAAKAASSRPTGDGTFEEELADAADGRYEAWAALPACHNDAAWDVVRENIGLGRMTIFKGPYYDHPAKLNTSVHSKEYDEAVELIRQMLPATYVPGGGPVPLVPRHRHAQN